jgi:formate/nitrite transporter FocA (FNT family)
MDSDRNQKDEDREEQEVHEKTAAGAHIVYKAIMNEGEEELDRSSSALAWSGLAAGLSMGFSLMTEGLLRAHLPEAHWRPLVAKLGYSIGFLVVILGRQQLFTENTLTVILPLMKRRNIDTLGNVIRLWAIVLVTNVIGVAAFAYVAAKTQVFNEETRQAFLAIGKEAIANGAWVNGLRGVFAGWLIALMVWLLPVAETARVAVIVVITYLVALAQFSHIIAGSADALYVVAGGQASFWDVMARWFAPTLAGNVIGGTTIVAALNRAQVVSGEEEE